MQIGSKPYLLQCSKCGMTVEADTKSLDDALAFMRSYDDRNILGDADFCAGTETARHEFQGLTFTGTDGYNGSKPYTAGQG